MLGPTPDGRTLRRERSAARLFDAALELFEQHSFDEVTVDDICRHAGIGRATYFRIFETKAGLLREFNRRLTDDAAKRIAAITEPNFAKSMACVRDAVLDAWRDASPGLAAAAIAYNQSRPNAARLHAPHPELLSLVHELVQDAVRAGELSDAVPADLAASIALIHLSAPIAYRLAGKAVDIDALCHTMLNQWYVGMTQPSTSQQIPRSVGQPRA